MIVVTGATGRTGRQVAELLLAKGEKVRAVGRDATKLSPLVALGAEPFVGTVADLAFLIAAFAGAKGAYLVLSEDLSQPDLRAHQEQVSDCYAAAIANAQVKFVVSLSSIGAQHAEGTGPIVGLHKSGTKVESGRGTECPAPAGRLFYGESIHDHGALARNWNAAWRNAGRCGNAVDSDERYRGLRGKASCG